MSEDVRRTSMDAGRMRQQLLLGLEVGATCMVVWALIVFAVLVARHSWAKDRQRRLEEERRRRAHSNRAMHSHLSSHAETRLGEHNRSPNFHHLAFSSRSFNASRPNTSAPFMDSFTPNRMPLHKINEPFLGRPANEVSFSGVASLNSSQRSGEPAIVPFRSSRLPLTENIQFSKDGHVQPDARAKERKRKKEVLMTQPKPEQRRRQQRHPPARKTSPEPRKDSSSSSSNQEFEMTPHHKPLHRAASPLPREAFSWTAKEDNSVAVSTHYDVASIYSVAGYSNIGSVPYSTAPFQRTVHRGVTYGTTDIDRAHPDAGEFTYIEYNMPSSVYSGPSNSGYAEKNQRSPTFYQHTGSPIFQFPPLPARPSTSSIETHASGVRDEATFSSAGYPGLSHRAAAFTSSSPRYQRSVSHTQDDLSIDFSDEENEAVWLPRNSPHAARVAVGSLLGYTGGRSVSSSSSGSDIQRRSNIPSFVAAEYDRIMEPSHPITIPSKSFKSNQSKISEIHPVPDCGSNQPSQSDAKPLPDSGYYDELLLKSSPLR